MLISDSMPLLWLVYGLLSLVVLVTGYLGIRFLPRLPRCLVTGVVAGLIWIPGRFSLPISESETYTGMAPAIMVAAVAFLQEEGGAFGSASLMLLMGAALGVALGVVLWRLTGRGAVAPDEADDEQEAPPRRKEPMIG